jgi:hypothetical protein
MITSNGGHPSEASAGVSIRLVQILRTYCYNLGPASLADLRASLVNGRHPWFQDEFEAAIRAAAFTVAAWQAAVGAPRTATTVDLADLADLMHDQQRQIWRALFPQRRFPGRARVPRRAPARQYRTESGQPRKRAKGHDDRQRPQRQERLGAAHLDETSRPTR